MGKKPVREIYFDNSATTPVLPEVADMAVRLMCEDFGNPSALYRRGMAAEKLMRQARDIIARSINARSEEIIFTSGGTESNNTVLRGVMQAARRRGRHMIISAVEHPSVMQTAEALRDEGFELDILPVDADCRVSVETLRGMLRPDTVLVSVMLVNNEVGSIQPIAELAGVIAEHNRKYEKEQNRSVKDRTLLHVDAVQAYGKLPIDVRAMGIDLLSVSGHKLHAPKGTGFMYAAKDVRWLPLLTGGGQESNRRSGTENTPGICALGLAAELASKNMQQREAGIAAVRRTLLDGLAELSDWQINGAEDAKDGKNLPNVLNISFGGVKSEILLHMLETEGLCVSSGSACAAKKDKLSHVLLAMGCDRKRIEGAIRFSFSCLNTVEEAEIAAKIVCRSVGELREMLR